MSEVRLVVREAGRDWSGNVHGSWADRAIAALSADPVTLTELEAACARYALPDPDRPFFANLSPGLRDEPFDAGIVVIDLVARLVLVDSTYSSPEPTGDVCYHDGDCATDMWLRYHLADDWLFLFDHLYWAGAADQRRRERAASPALDARAVFYGRPLLEFLAREVFAAHTQPAAATPPASDTIQQIHIAWQLTPRDDLAGRCPREVAWQHRDHLSWDLQDQANRWSRLGECPPGLDEMSFAYRYGGFGIHELVQHYELVRELLWSCWERLVAMKSRPPASLALGDFLTAEISRLECVRDDWLDTCNPDLHGRTPRSVIERERARLPEGVSAHEAIVDPDCPCCQMLADLPGPVFWHLDGCEMDDDFAFDLFHESREGWDEEQLRWAEHNRRFNAEWEARKSLGVTGSGTGEPGEENIWSSSFSVGEDTDVPLGVRLFGIGCHLAELVTNIRGDADASSAAPEALLFIDRLNRGFGNLREILQTAVPSLAETLLSPVIVRFTESLAAVAAARPELAAKCESLSNRVTRFLEPESSESARDSGDSDIPF